MTLLKVYEIDSELKWGKCTMKSPTKGPIETANISW